MLSCLSHECFFYFHFIISIMGIKFYYDFLSMPSRALYIYFKLTKIPFESCPIALRKAEHLSEKYKSISRFRKVPTINHDSFNLGESVAIVRYVTREQKVVSSLYPNDSKLQARVDEFLEWQHNNIRAYCGLFFRLMWVEPRITGEQPVPEKVQEFKENMERSLEDFQNLWLSDGPYITGDTLTAADIFAACDIEQPRLCGYDPCIGRPILAKWLDRVQKELNPVYEEAHGILRKYSAKVKSLNIN